MKKHRTEHEYKVRKNKIGHDNKGKTTKYIEKKSSTYQLMNVFLHNPSKYFDAFRNMAILNADFHELQMHAFRSVVSYFEEESELSNINDTPNIQADIPCPTFSPICTEAPPTYEVRHFENAPNQVNYGFNVQMPNPYSGSRLTRSCSNPYLNAVDPMISFATNNSTPISGQALHKQFTSLSNLATDNMGTSLHKQFCSLSNLASNNMETSMHNINAMPQNLRNSSVENTNSNVFKQNSIQPKANRLIKSATISNALCLSKSNSGMTRSHTFQFANAPEFEEYDECDFSGK